MYHTFPTIVILTIDETCTRPRWSQIRSTTTAHHFYLVSRSKFEVTNFSCFSVHCCSTLNIYAKKSNTTTMVLGIMSVHYSVSGIFLQSSIRNRKSDHTFSRSTCSEKHEKKVFSPPKFLFVPIMEKLFLLKIVKLDFNH